MGLIDSPLAGEFVSSPNWGERACRPDMILLHYTGMAEADAAYATLNVNAFERAKAFLQLASTVSYDGEDDAARRARRRTKWTPAVIAVGDGA